LDEADLRSARGARVGVLYAVEVEHERFGVHGRAVMEARALHQVEGVGETVVADLPRLGQARGYLEVKVHLHDGGEDVVKHVARRRSVSDVRVQVRWVIRHSDGDTSTVTWFLSAGAKDQPERDEHCEQRN